MPTIAELKAAFTDPRYYAEVGQGLLDSFNRGAVGGLLGTPVDMANGVVNAGKMVAGYVGHKTGLLSPGQMPQPDTAPIGGSEWWGQKMQDAGMVSGNRNIPAEMLMGVAGIPLTGAAAAKVMPKVENALSTLIRNAQAPTPYNTATGGQTGMVNVSGKNIVLRDSLGIEVPNLTVSGFGGYYGPPKYYSVSSTASNIPEELMAKFSSIEEAENALNKYGISFTKSKDFGGYPKLDAVDQFTLDEMVSIQKQIDETFKNAKRVFLRFGDIPETGFSKNYVDGTNEKGVSVFNGLFDEGTGKFMATPNTNQELGSFLSMRSRPVYLVDGDPIGAGSDGEPLLKFANVIKRLR